MMGGDALLIAQRFVLRVNKTKETFFGILYIR